ncbi:MAG: hypothetical protein HDR77_10235 [Bacteroides sp.]|nr:hypothetical protein [Bacteroides sp.]MBD5375832.1 hypothetical protein [Bacteroides sp.]
MQSELGSDSEMVCNQEQRRSNAPSEVVHHIIVILLLVKIVVGRRITFIIQAN